MRTTRILLWISLAITGCNGCGHGDRLTTGPRWSFKFSKTLNLTDEEKSQLILEFETAAAVLAENIVRYYDQSPVDFGYGYPVTYRAPGEMMKDTYLGVTGTYTDGSVAYIELLFDPEYPCISSRADAHELIHAYLGTVHGDADGDHDEPIWKEPMRRTYCTLRELFCPAEVGTYVYNDKDHICMLVPQ
jgi:hypothetical protein